jgi:hypothetical protein
MKSLVRFITEVILRTREFCDLPVVTGSIEIACSKYTVFVLSDGRTGWGVPSFRLQAVTVSTFLGGRIATIPLRTVGWMPAVKLAAKAFAESGASVVLADWNEKAVQSAAKELADKGYKTRAIRCDVSDDAQVEVMVQQTVATFGQLDAAYNNAGIQNVLADTFVQLCVYPSRRGRRADICHGGDDPIVRAIDQIVQIAGRYGPQCG